MRHMLLGVLATALLVEGRARGGVRDDATRVADLWRQLAASVQTAPSRFLDDEEKLAIRLPPGPPAGCVNVALVAARGASFHASLVDDPSDDDEQLRGASTAGVLSLVRCAEPVRSVRVVVDAGRGALEVVTAFSNRPLPLAATALPERMGGATRAPVIDAGELPPLAQASKRADAAEERARRDGGKVQARARWAGNASGAGSATVELEAGCHRVELFALDPRGASASRRRAHVDLDAEIVDDDGDVLARDRSELPDARLGLCTGTALQTQVRFTGAPGRSHVVATRAYWPIPAVVPSLWGAEVRGRIAGLLFARHVVAPRDAPVFLAQGPAGGAAFGAPVVPGSCYLGLAVVAHGTARGLALRVTTAGVEVADDRSQLGAMVAFCTRSAHVADVGIDVRGSGVAWTFSLYRVASGLWEAP